MATKVLKSKLEVARMIAANGQAQDDPDATIGGDTAIAIVDQVAEAVRKGIITFQGAVSEYKGVQVEAQTLLDNASDVAAGKREKVLLALAKFSHEHKLSEDDIKEGVKKAIKAYVASRNDGMLESSLGPMGTEFRRAMHKHVRGQLDNIMARAKAAWDGEANKSEDEQPLHRTFPRRYALVQSMATIASKDENGRVPSIKEMTEKAHAKIANKPHAKAVAAIKGLVKKLEEVLKEFPLSEVEAMIRFAKKLNLDKMEIAAAKMRAYERPFTSWSEIDEADEDEADEDEPEVVLPVPVRKPAARKPTTRKPNAAPSAADMNEATENVLGQ